MQSVHRVLKKTIKEFIDTKNAQTQASNPDELQMYHGDVPHNRFKIPPVGTFAISHQLTKDGDVKYVLKDATGRPTLGSPVCEMGPKTDEDLYWGKLKMRYFAQRSQISEKKQVIEKRSCGSM